MIRERSTCSLNKETIWQAGLMGRQSTAAYSTYLGIQQLSSTPFACRFPMSAESRKSICLLIFYFLFCAYFSYYIVIISVETP